MSEWTKRLLRTSVGCEASIVEAEYKSLLPVSDPNHSEAEGILEGVLIGGRIGEPILPPVCPSCSAPMIDRKRKLLCTRCGYFESCADLI